MRSSRPFRLACETLEPRYLLAIDFSVQTDLNAATFLAEVEPREIIAVGDQAIFAASTPFYGRELWTTDGTEAGTQLLMDLWPGPWSAIYDQSPLMVRAGDFVFFAAQDRAGRYLWSTDGTAEGTTRLLRLGEGEATASSVNLFAHHDRLIVSIEDRGLFVTAGTPPSTIQLSEEPLLPSLKLDSRYLLYDSEFQQWTTDGTPAGTRKLDDFPEMMGPLFTPFLAGIAGDRAAFFRHADERWELWGTDGLPGGTSVIHVFADYTAPFHPGPFHQQAESLFFSRRTETEGQLWRTDGTSEGTHLVRTFSHDTGVMSVASLGDRVFFSFFQEGIWRMNRRGELEQVISQNGLLEVLNGELLISNGPSEYWISDGTQAGTRPFAVEDFPGDPFIHEAPDFTLVSERYASDDTRLWFTDGTSENTRPIADFEARIFSYAQFATDTESATVAVNGKLLFSANGIWATDGTSEGTQEILNFSFTADSRYTHPVSFDDRLLLFSQFPGPLVLRAYAGNDVTELARFPSDSRLTNDWFRVGGDMFFTVEDELWTTNGTAAGTRMIDDGLLSPWSYSGTTDLIASETHLFFRKDNETWSYAPGDAETRQVNATSSCTSLDGDSAAANGSRALLHAGDPSCGVVVSDGTLEGTRQMLGESGQPIKAEPNSITAFGDGWVFSGQTGYYSRTGYELWFTDGSTSMMVRDLIIGTTSSSPDHFTVVGDRLFLSAATTLWQWDPKVGLPERISTDANVVGYLPVPIAALGDRLLYSAGSPSRPPQLWSTDGTPEGSRMLHPHYFGEPQIIQRGSQPPLVLFVGTAGATGQELWVSDGTPEGTTRLTDIYPGPGAAEIDFIDVVDGTLFFTADDGRTRTLWQSQGTRESTMRVDQRGDVPARPEFIAKAGEYYYTFADHPNFGKELWLGTVTPVDQGWQNPLNRLDVDDDRVISPLDALAAIVELTQREHSDPLTGRLHDPNDDPALYLDVDGDGFLGPVDALLVIQGLPQSSSAMMSNAALISPFTPIAAAEHDGDSPDTIHAAIWQDELDWLGSAPTSSHRS